MRRMDPKLRGALLSLLALSSCAAFAEAGQSQSTRRASTASGVSEGVQTSDTSPGAFYLAQTSPHMSSQASPASGPSRDLALKSTTLRLGATNEQRPLSRPLAQQPPCGPGQPCPVYGAAAMPRRTLTKWGILADVVVDHRGTGDFKTLQEAVAAAPAAAPAPFVIHIKSGVYRTELNITKPNITLVGDGAESTVLWGDRSFERRHSTLGSANIIVQAEAFAAVGLTFSNPVRTSAAVALLVDSDRAVFWQCAFKGYQNGPFVHPQDTLCAHAGRQYYHNCSVQGYVDFIFGDAAAVFEGSSIRVLSNRTNGPGVIMASGRRASGSATGLVFLGGTVEAVEEGAVAYLGRPWKRHARMVFMNTNMTQVVHPDGWMSWGGERWGNKPFYGEYRSTGPGARKTRVAWAKPGQISAAQAVQFQPHFFLDFRSWIHSRGMPRAFFRPWLQRK